MVCSHTVARQKLVQLNAAATLDFLRVPPGNSLEGLKDDRVGQHSIRINAQYRLCFVRRQFNLARAEYANQPN